MPEELAIRFSHVSKVYQLFGSQTDQLISVLGFERIGIKPRQAPKEFVALRDITFDVPRGHRIGIVGRNGAGKTTLLKLICGNFMPTSGEVTVRGGVQALMNIGLGFHPEYTGRENVEASLQYNGLLPDAYEEAIEGIT
ncbi:MAG: ATP-binding cassette domain-containing protein, partial [Geminicoccaceae bacterium]